MFVRLMRVGAALGRRRLLVPLGAAARRFARCAGGICSVEFVIVLPLFILFTFGIIGFAAISFAHNNMVNAAREATRRLAVADGVTCSKLDVDGLCAGVPVTCGTLDVTAGTAEDIACTYLAGWSLDWSVTASETVVDACDSTMAVNISTSAEDAFIVDFLGFFGADDLLVADVKMRKELDAWCTL